MQLEQNQLNDQLEQKAVGDKELRTDLAEQLHTLHQVVKQKKQEHSKVRKDWERSQEQYNHLKQTVGLLQGSAVTDDDNDDQSLTDDLNGVPGQRAAAKQLLGSMVIPTSGGASSSGDAAKKQIEDFTWEESVAGDNDTVITDITKDSLQVHHRNNRSNQNNQSEFDDDTSTVITEMTKDSMQLHRNRRSRKADDDNTVGDNGTVATEHTKDSLQMYQQRQSRKAAEEDSGGLTKFFTKEAARSRSPNGHDGAGSRGSGGKPPGKSLGAFFEKERKKPAKDEKDTKSASE